jgi:hypothetical protein
VSTALSTGLTTTEADQRIDATDAEIAAIRSDVLRPEAFDFTVTARDAPIPVRIENVGDTPLKVVVHVEAEKLTLVDSDITAVLEPNAVTVVPVDVTARSNGVFPVLVELRTPAGNQLTAPVELTARVSTLTGLGRVFTVGALLVLASWWFSYFRRRRRHERAVGRSDAQDRHPTASARNARAPDTSDLPNADPDSAPGTDRADAGPPTATEPDISWDAAEAAVDAPAATPRTDAAHDAPAATPRTDAAHDAPATTPRAAPDE